MSEGTAYNDIAIICEIRRTIELRLQSSVDPSATKYKQNEGAKDKLIANSYRQKVHQELG